MQLTLEIASYHKYATETEISKSFSSSDHGRLITLGRVRESDWYLPDPERVISAEHAQILITKDSFVIRDVSTNGLFINGSASPLGPNNTYYLEHGDEISISDYQIKVCIQAAEIKDVSLVQKIEGSESVRHSESEADEILVQDFGISSCLLVDDAINTQRKRQTLEIDLDESFQIPDNHSEKTRAVGSIPEDWSLSLDSQDQLTKETAGHAEETFAALSSKSSTTVNLENIDIYDSFVKGLGINPSMIPDASNERFWILMGSSLRLLLEGIAETLHSRTEFKQQKRLNQTLFQKTENNPIKYSGTIEDLIHNLFIRESTSFMGPELAIKEAFDDIKEHEKALQAGLEGSIQGILTVLSPKNIKVSSIDEAKWRRKLFTSESKDSWNNYQSVYKKMTNDMNGYKFYMDDFNKAYETYINSK
ncbi:type VI secretion system-associated FHA domain protein TagH [Photobacterium sp. TY1-4]|uniref:type VI secretion system-associated FHA domain protein TagH n=1 Tax=Photobacterium sp. TY1-4 TaxID=2899122 RepID=UPI0021BEF37E|nr:type VI secretion system-associated FHA domain protein TagH [Photobacterium sp. TY1-4]UXI02678.1 type VI secretion system-associated FHA domain protein TagH [Photobacterium sp. TY1-4]